LSTESAFVKSGKTAWGRTRESLTTFAILVWTIAGKADMAIATRPLINIGPRGASAAEGGAGWE